MMSFLRIVDWMNVGIRYTVGAILGVMVLVIALQIIVRFVLPGMGLIVSVPWSEETARYLMIWCIFLGAAVAARSGALIAVDTLPDSLPQRTGDLVRLAALLITVGFFGHLIWLGWRWVEFGESETSTVLNLPMAWVYLALPVGATVAIINICAFIVEHRIKSKTSLAVAAGDNPENTLV
ncbi:TRAP transporter small permease [Bradyrhizobium sp. Arg237L]|uniref:TRAP transporter small permease n=1 Tax=Bradyrhizobium sp. Arg237L TaxID=3003352 RepID=UPI00249E937F|nr:TRAP transporter small permease [Bradyrhizobium sp. Arg237L]MDI4237098.1 TRAP transporter small permease [Bradyrhizobium sp. Arg237L]